MVALYYTSPANSRLMVIRKGFIIGRDKVQRKYVHSAPRNGNRVLESHFADQVADHRPHAMNCLIAGVQCNRFAPHDEKLPYRRRSWLSRPHAHQDVNSKHIESMARLFKVMISVAGADCSTLSLHELCSYSFLGLGF